MTTTPAMPELPDSATVLPDGSAFAIASFPLPSDHWLYAPREYRDGEEEPIELPSPILSHQAHGDVVRAAIRYAVRSATMCGKEPDFDPDALVRNAMYALCGPFGGATLQAQPAVAPTEHIKEPYTLAELNERIASNDYNAELLLQHAMLLLNAKPAEVSDAEIRPDANLPFVEDEQGAEWVTLSPAMFARAVRRVLAQRPAAQTEREADVYGSTDIPWSFAVSRKLEPQEKRLMSMLVKAFGADHPSIDDMAQLILTRSAPKPPAPTSGNILTDAFNEVQALKQQATPTREAREAEQRARMQARLATSHEGKATADFDLPAPNDAPQQATPAQEPGVFREYFDAHRALIAAKGVSERASHAHIVGYRAPSHSTGSEPYAASVARNDQLKRADDAARCARKEAEARFNAALSAAQSATQQATPEPDRDGDAFRTAARLGLTLRFYGGCAQSGMPGSPSAYEVVSAGGDPAAAMREAVERASAVIHAGGQAQKLATPEPGLLKTFLAEADRAGITHLPATFGADLAAATPEPEFDDCSSSPTGKHSESWFGNGDCDHCKTGAQNAPMAATPEPLTSFDDPRAQIVYDLLCSDEAPPPEQHWEGWVARRIVDALAATPEPVGEPVGTVVHAKLNGQSKPWVTVALNQDADLPDGAKLFTHPAPGVPEGFALVPVYPTISMLMAGDQSRLSMEHPSRASAVWAAMLAARPLPAPPAQRGEG